MFCLSCTTYSWSFHHKFPLWLKHQMPSWSTKQLIGDEKTTHVIYVFQSSLLLSNVPQWHLLRISWNTEGKSQRWSMVQAEVPCSLISSIWNFFSFCAYGLACNALCHRGWVSECKTVSVAQWLSAGFSRERPGFDITTRQPVKVLKVSSAFVTTRANG